MTRDEPKLVSPGDQQAWSRPIQGEDVRLLFRSSSPCRTKTRVWWAASLTAPPPVWPACQSPGPRSAVTAVRCTLSLMYWKITTLKVGLLRHNQIITPLPAVLKHWVYSDCDTHKTGVFPYLYLHPLISPVSPHASTLSPFLHVRASNSLPVSAQQCWLQPSAAR